MSALNDILKSLPLNQLAEQLGADPQQVEQAAVPAVTSILGGLTQNAQNPEGELSLAEALNQHSDSPLQQSDQLRLDQVDAAEGEKILGHVFGNQTDGVAQALSSQAGVSNDLVKRLLPLLAPVVMSYLAKQLGGGQAGGNVLGQVLGGQMGGGQIGGQNANSGVLGGVLSQVLGQVLGGQGAPTGNPFDPSNAQATTQQAQNQGGDIVSQILGGLLNRR